MNPREKQSVHSAIPTLILDGQYDPITPPAYGALVQKTLSHADRFVYPGYGHAIRWEGTCVSDMTWAFLDHPTRKPDATCISGMVPAFF